MTIVTTGTKVTQPSETTTPIACANNIVDAMNDQPDQMLFGMQFEDSAACDQVLGQIAAHFKQTDKDVRGYFQSRGTKAASVEHSEMSLTDLSDGSKRKISLARGKQARGCHLDGGSLVEAANALKQQLFTHPDLLIINRFGHAEADGGGMREVIATALELNIRTIVAYRSKFHAEWLAFQGGIAADLEIV